MPLIRHLINARAEQHQLSLAEILVERAAFYEEKLKAPDDGRAQEHRHFTNRLSSDYMNLRIALVGFLPAHIALPLRTI